MILKNLRNLALERPTRKHFMRPTWTVIKDHRTATLSSGSKMPRLFCFPRAESFNDTTLELKNTPSGPRSSAICRAYLLACVGVYVQVEHLACFFSRRKAMVRAQGNLSTSLGLLVDVSQVGRLT